MYSGGQLRYQLALMSGERYPMSEMTSELKSDGFLSDLGSLTLDGGPRQQFTERGSSALSGLRGCVPRTSFAIRNMDEGRACHLTAASPTV